METLNRDYWTIGNDMRMLKILKAGRTFDDVASTMGITAKQAKTRASALGIREGFSKMMTGEEIQEADARDRDAAFVGLLRDAWTRGEFPK